MRLIIAVCLIASISAFHIRKNDFNVVIDELEFNKLSTKYKLDVDKLKALTDILQTIHVEEPKEPRAGTEAILNDYADKIFADLQHMMIENGFDPLEMPSIHEGFNYTLIITYHGELDLTDGWLSDVTTLHRGGDVIVSYSTDTKYLEITVPVAFNDLRFTYDYSAKIMGLGPVGYIDGKVTDLNLEIKLGFDTQTLLFSLDEFNIIHAGNINVEFHGDVLIDWLLDLLALVATTVLKNVILDIVENVVRGGLEGAVDAINEAINGFLNPTTPVLTTTPIALFLS